MSGNLHKSDAGWVRLRARVNADLTRQSVRSAKMDYRVSASKPKPVKVDEGGEPESPYIVRKGRKQRLGFVAHNGRY